MRALVVGGAGSTGTPIVEGLLRRNYAVTVLHRGLHEADLPAEIEHIHADPHWKESVAEALEGRSYDVVVAVYGRLRHFAELLRGRTGRLISVGGALAVYKGWMRITDSNPWDSMEESPVPVSEDHPLARAPGVDRFSQQVRESEDLVMKYHREGHYVATHFRYPSVYGPRHLAAPEWAIMRRALDGRREVIAPGGGMVIVSRGFADNLAHAVMLALDNPRASGGQIYNICDEGMMYGREWVQVLSDILNHEFELIEMPFDMLPKGFRAAPPLLLFRYHRVMDISKIKLQLGYRDQVPVKKALETTVQWYLERPPERKGELEQNLGDPFDYEYEDRLIEIYRTYCLTARDEISQVPAKEIIWRHPYPHPQKRGDTR